MLEPRRPRAAFSNLGEFTLPAISSPSHLLANYCFRLGADARLAFSKVGPVQKPTEELCDGGTLSHVPCRHKWSRVRIATRRTSTLREMPQPRQFVVPIYLLTGVPSS